MAWSQRCLLVVILASALASALVGCGGRSGGPEDQGARRPAAPPDVAGTWVGTFEEGGRRARMMLSLEQNDEGLSGYASLATAEETGYADPLEGTVRPGRGFELSHNSPEEDVSIGLDGTVSGPDSMTGTTSGAGTEGRFELERLELADLEEASLAVVQAVHDRNFRWLAEHGHAGLRDYVGAEGEEDFEGEFAEAFEEETEPNSYQVPPPASVRVEVVEESFTRYESLPEEGAEFDYRTSDGGAGLAIIALVRAGTERGGYAYQIGGVELDYRAGGEEGEIVLGS